MAFTVRDAVNTGIRVGGWVSVEIRGKSQI